MNVLRLWWIAFRPKTLTAAIVPVMVGSGAAVAFGYNTRWSAVFFALISSLFIQIATNLVNDAADFETGADTAERIGPQRVTQGGLLDIQQVWLGAYVSFGIAALAGIPLIYVGGWPILLIGICSLLAGYAYTAGPFPLAYNGLGDLFVFLFFGLAAVGGIYYLHSGIFEFPAVVAGMQVGMLSTVLIAINNLRDHEQDRVANKKTMAVRFGKNFARYEITLLVVIPFLLGLVWLESGVWLAGLLPLLLLPFAARIISGIWRTEPSSEYNIFLGEAAFLHLSFGILSSVGMIVS